MFGFVTEEAGIEEDSNGIIGSYFSISDNCKSCLNAETVSEYSYQTTFYMTGDLYGCNWSNKNLCGFDLDTLECQICTNTFFDDEIMSDWGSCGHLPAPAWHTIESDHDVKSLYIYIYCLITIFSVNPFLVLCK